MFSILGKPSTRSRGWNRRRLLQAGGAGLLGLSLPKLWAAEQAATGGRKPRARSVIFLFLFGGPSQFETFDMKPDAPADIRGPFQPIRSRTPELRICQHLPRLADISDRYCVVRTVGHDLNDHSGGGHYVQTGRRWHIPLGGGFSATPDDWPSLGSVLSSWEQQRSGSEPPLPSYVVLPNRLGRLQEQGQYVRPGEYAGWLGRPYNPLTTRVDKRDDADNPYWRDCSDEELVFGIDGLDPLDAFQLDRLKQRVSLLEQFDDQRRLLEHQADEIGKLRRRAIALIDSPKTREALDVRREDPRVRDLYGRHLFGQSALLARRLIEAGVRFVTVHYDACDGYSWDSHVHSRDLQHHLLPTLDQALSALLIDLERRGLLEETLVVALGEMGRTPKPTAQWGRGHWSTLFPAVLAGAGVRGGTVFGTSDRQAAEPLDDPTCPEDLAATIYDALGLDPGQTLLHPSGRPVPLVNGGAPLRKILG